MLHPLRFEPILRRYIWGGRRLGDELGKPIGAGNDYAESWEIVDHGDDQSVVAAGPLSGATLGQLVRDHGRELFGRHNPLRRFPLLLKLLDANRKLSVQVHPNDRQAARLDPPDLGKTEAWVVLGAAPGGRIYAGLKSGCDRAALAESIQEGRCVELLHSFEPQVGDCVFIPAGVVHALGEGLLIAEIQQASDTTYRLYDWDRVQPDGSPRPLHIEQALDVIDFGAGPVAPQSPQIIGRTGELMFNELLVACDKFELSRWTLDSKDVVGGDGRFHILLVVSGELDVAGDAAGEPLVRGQSILAPASCGATAIAPRGEVVLLEMHLP